MTMAAGDPSSSSAVRSAAYDTDSVDLFASEMGRFTFHADVTHAVSSRNANSHACGTATGAVTATAPATAPAAMTTATYSCAARETLFQPNLSASTRVVIV